MFVVGVVESCFWMGAARENAEFWVVQRMRWLVGSEKVAVVAFGSALAGPP